MSSQPSQPDHHGFRKIAKQREAKAAAVETDAAREQLEAAVTPADGRPPMSIKELERQEARTPEQAAAEEAEYQRALRTGSRRKRQQQLSS